MKSVENKMEERRQKGGGNVFTQSDRGGEERDVEWKYKGRLVAYLRDLAFGTTRVSSKSAEPSLRYGHQIQAYSISCCSIPI